MKNDDFRMMKVAMGLFAVILIYVMIRKPSESLKPDESSGESVGEFQKVQDDFQYGNAFGKRRASEADWAKVREIAEKFSPQIADLEREREAIIAVGAQAPRSVRVVAKSNDSDEEGFSPAQESLKSEERWMVANKPFVEAHRSYNRKLGLAEKAIRDLERAQWAEMSAHLSAYELRDYRMEHSFLGRQIEEETAWIDPPIIEGERRALLARGEIKNDFLDRHFDGNESAMNNDISRGWTKIAAIHEQHDKTFQEQFAEVQSSNDPDILYALEFSDLIGNVRKSTPELSNERELRLSQGAQTHKWVVDAEVDLARIEAMQRRGQATFEEVQAAHDRLSQARIIAVNQKIASKIEEAQTSN